MLFLSFFFFLVTSRGLKSFISCSMSWQIIQQKDRYYSKVLTLLFPAPISNEGERMKTSCFKKHLCRRWPRELLICMIQCYVGWYSARLKAWKCLWKINMLLNYFGEKIKSRNVTVDPSQGDGFPASRLMNGNSWYREIACVIATPSLVSGI